MRFGTDGVRGIANAALTPEYCLALGRATARAFGGPIAIGRDTRISGDLIEAAFAAGVCSEGADVLRLGVLPTPAVAKISEWRRCPAAVISASHNPFGDNGIKIFASGGVKLHDAELARLEAAVAEVLGGVDPTSAKVGAAVGVIEDVTDAAGTYLSHLLGVVRGHAGGVEQPLAGLRMILDCANGAASELAAPLFVALGADVTVLFAAPDGVNINNGCGSTHPDLVQSTVAAAGNAVGFALDGDADRVLAVDERGRLVDGDHLLAMLATDLAAAGELAGNAVVVTVMSNLGFLKAMEAAGISVISTAVGDRFVLEALESGSFTLGGEQSGHIIVKPHATTGDGLLAAALVSLLVANSPLGFAGLADAAMVRYPQVLLNVAITAPMPDVVERIASEIAGAEASLGADGRVLVRPSGTEPVVRVMVEALDESLAQQVATSLVAAVTAADHG